MSKIYVLSVVMYRLFLVTCQTSEIEKNQTFAFFFLFHSFVFVIFSSFFGSHSFVVSLISYENKLIVMIPSIFFRIHSWLEVT